MVIVLQERALHLGLLRYSCSLMPTVGAGLSHLRGPRILRGSHSLAERKSGGRSYSSLGPVGAGSLGLGVPESGEEILKMQTNALVE